MKRLDRAGWSCFLAALLLGLCLSGCAAEEPVPAGDEGSASAATAENQAETDVPEAGAPEGEPADGSGEPQPAPKQTVDTYPFMEGTPEENTVTVITSERPGPCVYVIGGVHGDELAGWKAALRLKDEAALTCGTLYILAPVNRSGAEAEARKVSGSGDLNRVFPGKAGSKDMAERLAAALCGEMERVKPDFILDLHEARYELGDGPTYGGLGNTLIFTDDTGITDLIFDFVAANEAGEVCSRKFGLTTPGVAGSFNRVISEQLGIPVITTETWRGLDLEDRISEQLEIVYFCLNYYGMADRPTAGQREGGVS